MCSSHHLTQALSQSPRCWQPLRLFAPDSKKFRQPCSFEGGKRHSRWTNEAALGRERSQVGRLFYVCDHQKCVFLLSGVKCLSCLSVMSSHKHHHSGYRPRKSWRNQRLTWDLEDRVVCFRTCQRSRHCAGNRLDDSIRLHSTGHSSGTELAILRACTNARLIIDLFHGCELSSPYHLGNWTAISTDLM